MSNDRRFSSRTWIIAAAAAAMAGVSTTLTVTGAVIGQPATETQPAQSNYQTYSQMTSRIEAIGRAYPDSARIQSIGTSLDGRNLWALTLAYDGSVNPDKRPAVLIVAGIDGNHLIGSEVALDVAQQLLANAASGDQAAKALLTDHTVYVVPRVNPDGMEQYFAAVKDEHVRNLRPDDRDRDMRIDEDGPNDLNGDGLITMMRVYDPKKADLMADPADGRLNVKPDPMKGERAAFTLYVEGIDDDKDGEYNEDPLGGVDLNMNFMHGYPEHEDGAGVHQVSEPESLSLLKYVLDHQNIAMVITYGRNDNLSKTPDGKGSYSSGTPKNILPDDLDLYKVVGEKFREITGLTNAPNGSSDGAFFAWAYAQFGVPSFTTPLWYGPLGEEKAKQPRGPRNGAGGGAGGGEENNYTPSGIGDIAQETIDELLAIVQERQIEIPEDALSTVTPQMVEQFAQQMGVEVKRLSDDSQDEQSQAEKSGEAANGQESEELKPRDKDEAAWLAYSDDERNGQGFVAWQEMEHPTLGHVEIGGWAPYFKVNPPAEASDAIAEKQTAFLLDLAGRFPSVTLTDPKIKRLAGGLYEIEVALVNDGFMPTGTAMSVRNQRARPYVIRLSTPVDNIISGQPVHKIWKIDGSGGRYDVKWIIRAPDASKFKITVYSEKYGQFTRDISLMPNQ